MKITFSKKNMIGKADRKIYGHFLEHFHRQVYGGVYDPESPFADEDGFRTDVLEALRKIKTPIIRWPGGCYASSYDWHYGVGKDRVPTFDKTWRVEESNEVGTDEFVKLCRKLDCEPFICTNAGSGTPVQMSNWVEYCNLKDKGIFARERIANGYEEPHAVKYWSVGNENYGSHELGALTNTEFGRVVLESAKMMLRVDPTLQVSAAALVADQVERVEELDWTVNLLKNAGRILDWISVHEYCDFTSAAKGDEGEDYNTVILYTGDVINRKVDRVRSYLTIFGLENKIKVTYDEWNLRCWHHPRVFDVFEREEKRYEDEKYYEEKILAPRDKNDVNSMFTMGDAVFAASFLNTCLRNCDIIKMACFSPVVNARGAIFTHKDGIVLRPQYFVFDLYANLLKENVLDSWSEDVPVITGMLHNKKTTIDSVEVVVTYDDDTYAASVVNKDPEKEQTVDFSIIGDEKKEMRIHTLNGATVDSYNDIGRTEVGITVSEWMPFTESITFPAHSVNVVEIR